VKYRDCQACDRQAPMLVDLGSLCFAIAPRSFFPAGPLVPATRPLRISAVNGKRLEGGTQGAVVDLGIAIEGCDGSVVEVVCEGAFVYMAEVQEQLIVGYPFWTLSAIVLWTLSVRLRVVVRHRSGHCYRCLALVQHHRAPVGL
jgi:hypothetical protein